MILPEHLIAHAGITDVALFAGLGNHFEIWAPEAFELHRNALRMQLSGGRP